MIRSKAIIDGMDVKTFVETFNEKCIQNGSFSRMRSNADKAKELDKLIKEYILQLSPGGSGLYRVVKNDIKDYIKNIYVEKEDKPVVIKPKQTQADIPKVPSRIYKTNKIMDISIYPRDDREKRLVKDVLYNLDSLHYWTVTCPPDRLAEHAKKVRAQIDILMQLEIIGMHQYHHLVEKYQIYVDELIVEGNKIRRKKGLPILKDKRFHGII